MAELPYLDDSTASAPPIPFAAMASAYDFELKSNKGSPNGYAGLGADGKIALSQLPETNALESEAIAFAIALG